MTLLDKAQGLSVLVIGETILDEYVYVYPMAKSPKEYVIATREDKRCEYIGGAETPFNILRGMCGSVDIATQTYEIRKTRFVDHSYMRKLFEVYRMGDARKLRVSDLLTVPHFDMVLVFDFGHGFIDAEAVDYLCHNANFLVVNTQTNAGNLGFNLINKYPYADMVCIDEFEARLASSNKDGDILSVIEGLRIDCSKFIITRGKHGCFVYDDGKCVEVPAITQRVLDTVGAGDTFLSYAAPLIASGVSMEEAARVGNIAGGLKTEIMGHSDYVRKESIEKWLQQNKI